MRETCLCGGRERDRAAHAINDQLRTPLARRELDVAAAGVAAAVTINGDGLALALAVGAAIIAAFIRRASAACVFALLLFVGHSFLLRKNVNELCAAILTVKGMTMHVNSCVDDVQVRTITQVQSQSLSSAMIS